MLHDQSGFRAVKRYRVVLSLLLILLMVASVAAQIRRVEIARRIQPSRAAGRYFGGHGRLGGGVVPWGSAEFLSPAKAKLAASQLQFVIIDESKLRNDRPDYNVIGIRWRGNEYQLTAQDDLIYPLMKFIERGSYIAYTIPPEDDETYFRQHALDPVEDEYGLGGAYVAREFNSAPHAAFLEKVDLYTTTEELPSSAREIIRKDLKVGKGRFAERSLLQLLFSRGSYVNADFHVKYQVFLDVVGGKKVVEVGGLPLRYSWEPKGKRKGVTVQDVKVFKFPEEKFDLQYRSVLFFQTAAILRQFKSDNPREFNRFLREISAVVGKE